MKKPITEKVKKALKDQIASMSQEKTQGNRISSVMAAMHLEQTNQDTLTKLSISLQKIPIETLKQALMVQAVAYINKNASDNKSFSIFRPHGDTGLKRAGTFDDAICSAKTIADIYQAIANASGGNYKQHSLNTYIARALMGCVDVPELRMSEEKDGDHVGLIEKDHAGPPRYDLHSFLHLAKLSLFVREDYDTPQEMPGMES